MSTYEEFINNPRPVRANKPEPPPIKGKQAQLPPYFKQLDLTLDQKSKVLKVRADFRAKAEDLKRQLDKIKIDEKEALERLQPLERDWSSERVFAVRLRIPTGGEQLEARRA